MPIAEHKYKYDDIIIGTAIFLTVPSIIGCFIYFVIKITL